MSRLRIGWAEESIVPEKKVSLAGQFFERISEYVESEITVTAMAVQADGEEMIMVSADVVKVEESLLRMARDKFAKLTNEISPEKLMVAATHSHTSLKLAPPKKYTKQGNLTTVGILEEFLPEGKGYQELVTPDENVITPEEGAEFLTDKIALAAKKAWYNRAEGYYANEFGRAAVGMCRRVSYDDGSAKMWGDTNTANFVAMEGGNDSGIELIYTFDKEKKLTGVVANIACPAQILEQRSFILGKSESNCA